MSKLARRGLRDYDELRAGAVMISGAVYAGYGFGLLGMGLQDAPPPAVSLSAQSLAIRAAANEAIRGVASRRGLARFMALTETQGGLPSTSARG